MADKQSKVETVTGVTFSEASFSYDKSSGKLNGIKEKRSNGGMRPVAPFLSDGTPNPEWVTVKENDVSITAYNIANSGGDSDNYISEASDIEQVSDEELQQKYDADIKAFNNSQFVASIDDYRSGRNIADKSGTFDDYTYFDSFKTYNTNERKDAKNHAYPLDLNIEQDHLKISKYKYVRADVNMSKPQRVEKFKGEKINVAGDSLLGKEPMGSIFLPMPKATDANACAWGKSEINSAGLMGIGAAEDANQLFSLFGLVPRADQVNREQAELQQLAKENQKRGDAGTGNFVGPGQQMTNNVTTSIASLLSGTEIDQDTYLARVGGHVQNPNAEMLFQGPVIRDFSFTYLMVARGQKEGQEIRNIIRFLKLGLAPKYRNTAFLANPDIFKLEYKNGKNDEDVLKTVNRFNPGGLALTAMRVDYAPNGYWSAYHDSQPVALKMDLSFTELRPIYEGDQQVTPMDSVGY